MELILALLLGMFWIFRLSSDKKETKKARDKYKKTREAEIGRENTWRSKVVDAKLEEDLDYRIHHDDEALAMEYMEIQNKFPFVSYGDPLRVLLAVRGKISYIDSETGYLITGYGKTQRERDLNCAGRIKFIRWVNDNLESNGVSERLFLDDNAGKIVPLDSIEFGVGRVKWAPMLSDFQIEKAQRK